MICLTFRAFVELSILQQAHFSVQMKNLKRGAMIIMCIAKLVAHKLELYIALSSEFFFGLCSILFGLVIDES